MMAAAPETHTVDPERAQKLEKLKKFTNQVSTAYTEVLSYIGSTPSPAEFAQKVEDVYGQLATTKIVELQAQQQALGLKNSELVALVEIIKVQGQAVQMEVEALKNDALMEGNLTDDSLKEQKKKVSQAVTALNTALRGFETDFAAGTIKTEPAAKAGKQEKNWASARATGTRRPDLVEELIKGRDTFVANRLGLKWRVNNGFRIANRLVFDRFSRGTEQEQQKKQEKRDQADALSAYFTDQLGFKVITSERALRKAIEWYLANPNGFPKEEPGMTEMKTMSMRMVRELAVFACIAQRYLKKEGAAFALHEDFMAIVSNEIQQVVNTLPDKGEGLVFAITAADLNGVKGFTRSLRDAFSSIRHGHLKAALGAFKSSQEEAAHRQKELIEKQKLAENYLKNNTFLQKVLFGQAMAGATAAPKDESAPKQPPKEKQTYEVIPWPHATAGLDAIKLKQQVEAVIAKQTLTSENEKKEAYKQVIDGLILSAAGPDVSGGASKKVEPLAYHDRLVLIKELIENLRAKLQDPEVSKRRVDALIRTIKQNNPELFDTANKPKPPAGDSTPIDAAEAARIQENIKNGVQKLKELFVAAQVENDAALLDQQAVLAMFRSKDELIISYKAALKLINNVSQGKQSVDAFSKEPKIKRQLTAFVAVKRIPTLLDAADKTSIQQEIASAEAFVTAQGISTSKKP